MPNYVYKKRLTDQYAHVSKNAIDKKEIQWMNFLNKDQEEMIKEKYTQLRLARQFGGINVIGFT